MKKSLAKVSIATGLLLIIPLILQLTIGTGIDGQGWNWKLNDFAFAGLGLFIFGMIFEFLASLTENKDYRIMIGIAVFLGFIFMWANAVNDFDVLERVIIRLIS